MCGIISIKGENIVEKTLDGLERLEYRGYDSCGICIQDAGRLDTIKTVGYISRLKEVVGKRCGNIAIAHTRWATHGEVTEANTHPHLSPSGNIAVVHNGIIENSLELKAVELPNDTFASDTDSEIIPHLVEKFYLESSDMWQAFCRAVSMLHGSYAIVLLSTYDDRVYFARLSSPMILAKTQHSHIIASDAAVVDTGDVYHIPDNTIGYLDNDFHVFDKNIHAIDIEYTTMDSGDVAGKCGYPHYMLKEIMEVPASIERTMDTFDTMILRLPNSIEHIVIVACGTSYHSALVGKNYIEKYARIKCEVMIASEFIYNDYLVLPHTLGIFISQSGETADTLRAVDRAKQMGMYTMCITNVCGSTITKVCDTTMRISAGSEICVASTKAYTTQVFALLTLTNALISMRGRDFGDDDIVDVQLTECPNALPYTPIELRQVLDVDIVSISGIVEQLASAFYTQSEIHLIGKDYDYISAQEGSLKIKEVSYIFTDAYPCGELKHGTLSLIDEHSLTIAISTEKHLIPKTQNAISEVVSRGGRVVVITPFVDEYSEYQTIRIPLVCPILMPIVAIIPLFLMAYHISVKRGIDPDKPRNLAKSVTVE